jgi:FkbM family methyltransferase
MLKWLRAFGRKVRKAIRATRSKNEIRLLALGLTASSEHAGTLKRISNLTTIVDIGANKGQFLLEALRWHPKAKYIVFEPLPEECAAITRCFNALEVYPFALGAKDQATVLNVSAASDSSSLLEQTDRQSENFPWAKSTQKILVTMKRLDSVLAAAAIVRPAFCKIDVQGYELEVLKGFGELIDCFDYFVIELSNVPFYEGQCNTADVISFLNQRSFIVADILNLYRHEGVCLQADFLFVRNKALKT